MYKAAAQNKNKPRGLKARAVSKTITRASPNHPIYGTARVLMLNSTYPKEEANVQSREEQNQAEGEGESGG